MAKRPRKAKLLEDQYPTHYLPNVGRQVMADGGVPEDTQRAHDFVQEQLYGDAYRPSPVVEKYAGPTAAQALEINRDRPASTASEFVRHQLSKDEPQLPQYDRENVQAWKEGAKELGHLAAYGIPYVGEGLMAYDLANAAKSLARPGVSSEDRAIDLVNAGLALPGMGRAAKAAAVAGAALAPEEAQAGVVDRALKAIRAYHGSPHKFDKFDISKIGTGEGAQAYGHGLYFAENPEVAHAYREALSPYGRGDRPEDIAARVLHATRGDRDAALAELRNRADTSLQAGGSYEGAQRLMEARNIVNTNPEVAGHMYEVDIHANPEHLIDWDKPIANQPNVVRGLNQYVDEMGGEQALKHFSKELEAKRRAEEESFARLWEDDQPLDLSDMMTYFNKNKYSSKEALTDLLRNIRNDEEPIGAEFYRSLAPQEYDYKGATETARRLGIPGLKYFDRLSRGAGTGSRNYVMFDPSLVDITRRYADGGIVSKALQAIRAYHGSPHKFNKFDINKVGTGEGVQAYGHGLYFSGDEDVARSYAENAEDKYAPGIIARRMLAGWPDRDTAIQKQMERIARLEQSHNEDFIAPYRGALDLLKSGEIPKAGHMYEVDIHADPEHLLDWHKRLHEQSPHVQANLKDMAQDVGMPMRYWKPVNPEDAATGEEYYSSLAQKFKSKTNPVWDPREASSELKSWALPGIQYIDPAARSDASRNYVMFDPKLIDIKRRYKKGGDVEGYDKGGAIAKVLGKLMAPGSGYAPRKGFPELVNLPGIGKVESRPIPEIESIARRFAGEAHGADVTPLNPEFSKRVAQEYDVMRHDPQDPIVKRAFQALADETMQQYRAAKDLGLDIKFLKPGQADPYAASPALGYEDIVNRGRLFVYPTEAGFGSTGGINASNVLLKGAGRIGDKEDAVVNDAFRVIHDLYGHFGPGNPFFRAPGEERAFQLHKRMFSPEARPALTSETRGQNSWVNFGDMAERNRAAKGADTYYADQKTGIMPKWTMEEPPAEGVNVDEYIRSLPHKDKGGAIAKALQAASRIIAPSEKMGVIHGVSAHVLPRLKELGAIPSPSLAITKPLLDNSNFGNITFVGRKHLAEPSDVNPIFGQDAFTARFPYIEGRNDKTFYSDAHNDVVPLNIENVLEHMRSRPVIGGENWTRGQDRRKELGVIMAEEAPSFKSLEDIKRARDNIVPMHEWTEKAQALEDQHTGLAKLLHRYSNPKTAYDTSDAEGYFGDALSSKNMDEWRHFYPEAPQETIDAALKHLEDIRKMPAMYFEGKPQRAVGFDEFAGAVVPEATYKDVSPILRDMGIKDVSTYAAPFERRGERVTKDFGEHMFADGGPVKNIPRADDEQFFRRLALWTYSVAPLFSNTHQLSQNRLGYAGGGKAAQELIERAVRAAKVITSEGAPTVRNMARETPLYPDVYKNPRLLAEEAEGRVAKEDPILKQLWGVNREDIYDIAGNRPGNVEPVLAPPPAKTRGINYASEAVMVPENAERLKNILEAGYEKPGLRKGMMPWYYMDPVYNRLEQMFGPEEAVNRYNLLNTSVSMMSPASNVKTEINRGLGAYHMALQGRFDDFVRGGGKPSAAPAGVIPPYMRDRMVGHLAHSTSQAGPLSKYMQTGKVEMESPKVPLYIQSSGVPETGFQTKLPVPDAHYTRVVGMPDVRRTADPEVSMKMNEYRPVGHWFREEVAKPMEMEAVPAQALMWGTGSGATGVDTAIGAPKLELLSQHIGDVAKHYRISPETARDLLLQGTLYKDGGAVIDRALDVVSNLPHARKQRDAA